MSETSRREFLGFSALAASAVVGVRSVTAGNAVATSRASDRIPVLFDTDLGSDIDDTVALAYLLTQPRCELLGITTVSSHSQIRAQLCDAV